MISKKHLTAFNRLIASYLGGKSTPDESAFVDNYYDSYEGEPSVTDAMKPEDKEALKGRLYGKIAHDIREQTPIQVIPIYRKVGFRMAAAAALLILLGGGWLWYQSREATPIASNRSHLTNDVLPGTDKAVLTLGNGRKISLDSASNGTVARQGNANILKISGGQLAYHVLPEKPDGTPTEVAYNTLTTPRGGQYQLTLPDGTHVWLNAASSIRYPTAFEGPARLVDITGEVYFEVQKNASQPFQVTVNGGQRVEVLGTSFNVNAYADEPVAATTLLEGSVRVEGHVLHPGEQARIDGQGGVTIVSQVNLEDVVAWKNGAFAFSDASLPAVMRQLSRWYDIKVEYEGTVPEGTFDGAIGRGLTLNQVLAVLAKERIHYAISGNTLTIRSQ